MKTKESEIKLVPNEKGKKVSKVNQTKIDELEKLLKEKKNEYSRKKFLLKCDKKMISDLYIFIEEYIQWKGMEAKGIVKLMDGLKEAEEDMLKNKRDGLLLSNMMLEVIAYHIQKYESKGLKEAKLIEPWIFPISEVIQEAKKISDKIGDLEREYYASVEGIEVEKDYRKSESE